MMRATKQIIEAHRKLLEESTGGCIVGGSFNKKSRAVAREVMAFASNLLDNAILDIESQAYVFAGALTGNDERGEVEPVHLETTAYSLCERLTLIHQVWQLFEEARYVAEQSEEGTA